MTRKAPPDLQWANNRTASLVLEAMRARYWNDDQFQAIWRAADLDGVARVGDFGAGAGGTLVQWRAVLGDEAALTLLDREPKLLDRAKALAEALGMGGITRMQVSDVLAPNLPEQSLDCAFCQTLLMHLDDPAAALDAMTARVRPGGVVMAVEPLLVTAPETLQMLPPAEAADLLAFWTRIRDGRRARGGGDNTIGGRLPTLFAAAGLEVEQVRLVDRLAWPGSVQELRDGLAARNLWREEFKADYLAASGTADEFEKGWERARQIDEDLLASQGSTVAPNWLGVLPLVAVVGRRPLQNKVTQPRGERLG